MNLKSLLDQPVIYKLFSALVGAQYSISTLVNQYVRPAAGDRILDIGCGPGKILDHLPQVDYFGFDFSPSYIESATRRYGHRGQFFCQRVSEAQVFLEQPESFDIVLAIGVLHHLDDAEAMQLFEIARRALKKDGVTADELARAKDHLKGNLMLSLESSSSRMIRLAKQELRFGAFHSVDEMLAQIDLVRPDEVEALIHRVLDEEQLCLVTLGPVDKRNLPREFGAQV